ncbi:MAG TPA: DUF2381 family protein, partial [Myxococcus sp.]|nr:DUF2381 family protein [Myxococcus sp.]
MEPQRSHVQRFPSRRGTANRYGFPSTVVLLLTGQPGTVDVVVNVRRPQQTVEACRVELST